MAILSLLDKPVEAAGEGVDAGGVCVGPGVFVDGLLLSRVLPTVLEAMERELDGDEVTPGVVVVVPPLLALLEGVVELGEAESLVDEELSRLLLEAADAEEDAAFDAMVLGRGIVESVAVDSISSEPPSQVTSRATNWTPPTAPQQYSVVPPALKG